VLRHYGYQEANGDMGIVGTILFAISACMAIIGVIMLVLVLLER
jgi:hypothetical protein